MNHIADRQSSENIKFRPSEWLKSSNDRFRVISGFGKVLRNTAFLLGEEIANKPEVVRFLGSIHLLAAIKIPLLTLKTFEDYCLTPKITLGLTTITKSIEKGGEFALSGLQLIKGLKAAKLMEASRFPWTSSVYTIFGPVFGAVVAVPIFSNCYRNYKFSKLLESSKSLHPRDLRGRLTYIKEKTSDKKIQATVEHILNMPKNPNVLLSELAVMKNIPDHFRKEAKRYASLKQNNTTHFSKNTLRDKEHKFREKAIDYLASKFFNELEQEARRKTFDDGIKATIAAADTIGALCLFAGATLPCSVFMAIAAVINFADIVRPKEQVAPAA